jgi:hypothetical protein
MVIRAEQGPFPDGTPKIVDQAVVVNIDLALTIALAVLWSGAGILADRLPRARDARTLRRRAGGLLLAIGAGVAAIVAIGIQEQGVQGLAALAVAALVVSVLVVPRLNRVRRGAKAFTSAPHAPMPPALRAAAAHPLVALPVQLTAIVALVSVTGIASAAVLGVALTAAGLVAGAIGVRNALRHNRLAEAAVVRRDRSIALVR